MVVALIVGGGALAGWFAVFASCLVLTRPRPVPAAPPTQEFGGAEPPAVVSLLANRWEVTADAAESTLLDLAARRLVELRQPVDDPAQTTVHVRNTGDDDLTAYERRVLDRVRGLAVDGVVPLTALTFRAEAEAKSWAKRLRADVVADARARGLSRRRFSPAILALLLAGAAVTAVAVFVAALIGARHTGPHTTRNEAFDAALGTFFGLCVLAGTVRGERDTAAGHAAATRWLGLRAYLRGDEAFANLPPAAVAVWDRYLSYGAALGTTRMCSAVIDLGLGDRRRVWSSYGGTWHRVRVRYPVFWARYGSRAAPLLIRALAGLVVGYALLRYRHPMVDGLPVRWRGPTGLVMTLLGAAVAARAGYRLVRAVADLAWPVTVTGEVLWTEPWRVTRGGDNRPSTPWLYYLAVDDGTDDRTTAWALPAARYDRCAVGDVVRLTARRWTRRVVDLTVVAHRTGDVAADPGAGDAPVPPSAVGTPDLTTGRLLSANDVAGAIGLPVVVRDAGGTVAGVLSAQTFTTGDARPAVYLARTHGLAGRLAMRARTRGAPLPGVGDEAYAGDGWAVARRGDDVVMVRLQGAAAGADPGWLLATAVSRLAE
ncbi:DUF2207 domain-containing protein [Planosporangium thailandense]|uniref:DUF2207 domain-containing protein n=1 Tax=Planosporangium thailandense TaxID=765197 RepID=A0ABX0XYT7_9ACTN|nr:DUF2207 domain-containing protein [Planosporangium thailandense]NJC70385.1 DUF2207 domain-containing protein [Planosporangium thailandense]